jgi:NTE family protein
VEAIHRSGPFSTWLQASVAIPGVFPPVVAGGAVHVDGGVLNNLPTDIVRDFGVSTVIAVDVGTDFAGAAPSSTSAAVDSARCPNMLDLLWRVGTINSTAKIESARRGCSILLRPDLGGIGRLNWRLCEQAIEAGYRAAEANIDAIKAALDAPGG